jgi:hypothetical protein
MVIKEGHVNLHLIVSEELHRRLHDVAYRQKRLGDRQASVNKNCIRAIESCIDKMEREVEAAEKKSKK